MSFIIAVHVKEGIVLASDSRITYDEISAEGGVVTHNLGVNITDTAEKTFLCPNNIGISLCGDASIEGAPIAGYVEQFIREKIVTETNVEDVPALLFEYFNQFHTVPDTHFIVAGYKKHDDKFIQKIYNVYVSRNQIDAIDEMETNLQGATWGGEIETLSRVINNIEIVEDGENFPVPYYEIPWNVFNLQDAIDFAEYAVDITIKTMHFKSMAETVGGPIDILVIKPQKSFWIQHKELHA